MTDPSLLARSRTLAKIALAGALALVGLVLSLPLFVEHATLSEAFLILWGLFILLAAIIAGVALSYVFLTRGLRTAEATLEQTTPAPSRAAVPTEGSEPPPPSDRGVVPELALRLLTGDERKLYRRIVEAGGVVLQKDLVGAGLFSGSKVTRVLDRLEGKGLIQRERHGMTNRIRLSDAWREKP
ncbi:MAG TPA: hypothetical protein VJN63_13215 [Thermoplasmata archaeon]|nr:hypothetical protein [Thermoplasmata archaeon]